MTLACSSAAGYVIPLLVVFDCKKLNPELTTGEIPGTMCGLLNQAASARLVS